MSAYYNELDPKAASWLRELIRQGHIADGTVDERDIRDVQPDDLKPFTQCHFFAGIGVWAYALRRAGWPDDRPVWTGSCPCQPFSVSGQKEGFSDSRHLWPDWFRLIRERKPHTVFGEQVASAPAWIDLVSGNLESEGYAFGSTVLGAHSVGAPHIRQRLYFVGNAHNSRPQRFEQRGNSTHQRSAGSSSLAGFWQGADWLPCTDGKSRPVEPGTFPLAHGSTARVGRLRGYGNAIVAPLAETFVKSYMEIAH